MIRTIATAAAILLTACGGGEPAASQVGASAAQADWQRWHGDKQAVDLAVAKKINAPGGGDYAGAIDVLRRSDRPEDVRQFQIGMLVIDGFEDATARRAPETLEQGLRMVEDATTLNGEMRRNGPQQLRLLFERGAGRTPDTIPVDAKIAGCWHRLENGGKGDPHDCIALRRDRLPKVGR